MADVMKETAMHAEASQQPDADIRVAERILAQSFGGAVRLAPGEDPRGGSGRASVRRCAVLDGPSSMPASVIVKKVNVGIWKADRQWGAATTRQRASTRFELLAQATAQFGFLEALGATAQRLAIALQKLWPEVAPMPYYPPFR